ncbi:hypothetical protein M011DRAFT_462275 [Sporormia fimetaria CBS 119925]|uniref:JmjC domain-containing histone demethylation protein 1 n=1 Tax=Sporormia fimetaria CBS 119925 TaxID=1340428 RepID=A0A6A6UZ96_9PLEO|nr:hypothetical protein M011DRAFT_462275 [Sporormia fimetaria CBS 119925]
MVSCGCRCGDKGHTGSLLGQASRRDSSFGDVFGNRAWISTTAEDRRGLDDAAVKGVRVVGWTAGSASKHCLSLSAVFDCAWLSLGSSACCTRAVVSPPPRLRPPLSPVQHTTTTASARSLTPPPPLPRPRLCCLPPLAAPFAAFALPACSAVALLSSPDTATQSRNGTPASPHYIDRLLPPPIVAMRVSSFKAQYRQQASSAAIPPPPIYEPISPILPSRSLPQTTSTALHDTHAKPFANGLPTHTPYEPLTPQPSRPPAAVSSLPVVPLPPNDRAPKHGYSDDAPSYSDRPPKRFRSDLYTSAFHDQRHLRPVTSHNAAWTYNQAHIMNGPAPMYRDRTLPDHPQESHSKRLSDAELLVNFAYNASHCIPRHVPQTLPAKRWNAPHSDALEPQRTRPMTAQDDHFQASLSRRHKTHAEAPTSSTLQPNHHTAEPSGEPARLTGHEVTPVQTYTPPVEPSKISPTHTSLVSDTPEKQRSKQHQAELGDKIASPQGEPSLDKTIELTPRPTEVSAAEPTDVVPSAPLQSPQSLLEVHISPEGFATPIESGGTATSVKGRRLSRSATRPSSVPATATASSSPKRARSVPLQPSVAPPEDADVAVDSGIEISNEISQTTICAGCRSSDSATSIGDGEQWISCDGCKEWFHYACAGFKSEREVRVIDKFYCDACKPKFGNTTKLRKSTRAHTAVDYAGLNEGILKTSDDVQEHHYIQAFKNGDLEFTPEAFARLPPECITADFMEKTNGFTEPVVIPAALNPRPTYPRARSPVSPPNRQDQGIDEQYELVPDDGQDMIDMVIPDGLTVRRVAELYGSSETVPVIDVKEQEGENKKWTMAKWADYYEQEGEKPVRNVISLEVSRSRLGKLIRRPKVVRDMDLQDSVWPEDDKAHAPPVQFYCLMSVADCYTDFHIDFGGSSVYYHIVKGRKTFFFIPPTKQNLKKYEDWCLSPRQSHDFLGLQVKECYRVDLFPGDTMLIPSGWIHAVWTPEDSLVIGGNFLTRIHYGMQIKVLEIEKNTKVGAKFRYPYFQKIMWLAVIKYLEEDPVPASVEQLLFDGGQFERAKPIYCEPDKFGHNSDFGPETFNKRYYPKAELEGLIDLQNYIWRTVMVSQGRIEGIPQTTRNAVTRSIPKGHGEPSVLARRFAIWAAWKRGNEPIPQWAYLENGPSENLDRRLSSSHGKQTEREPLGETVKLVRGGERHLSLRARVSEPSDADTRTQAGPPVTGFLRPHKEHVTTPKTSQLGPKRIACDACRKRRIRCKHKDELVESPQSSISAQGGVGPLNTHPIHSPPTAALGESTARRYSEADIPSSSAPFPLFELPVFELPGNIHSGPTPGDLSADALAMKSGRVKACADCRKSKRRCIHDENGNVDPVKAAEAPVPRGSASKKRRASLEVDGEALTKKLKMESFAGLVNGEVSQWNRYPLQRPRLMSAARSVGEGAIDPNLDRVFSNSIVENGHEPSPENALGTSTPNLGSGQTILPSTEGRAGDQSEQERHEGSEQHLLDSTATHGASVHHSAAPQTPSPAPVPTTHERNGFSVGSTASPSQGASHNRHHDAPRHQSRPPKAGSRSLQGKTTTPKSSPSVAGRHTVQSTPKSEQRSKEKQQKHGKLEDTASLALALQLQMEEHGLRRRSK